MELLKNWLTYRANGFLLLFIEEGSFDKTALLAALGSLPGRAGCEEVSHRSDLHQPGASLDTLLTVALLRPSIPKPSSSPSLSVSHNEKSLHKWVLLRAQPPAQFSLALNFFTGPGPHRQIWPPFSTLLLTPFLLGTAQVPGTERQSKNLLFNCLKRITFSLISWGKKISKIFLK